MFSVAAFFAGTRSREWFRPLLVRPNLRGFADDSVLVLGAGDPQPFVSITALAARRCPTGRDLYFEKRISPPSWSRFVLGKVVDALFVELYLAGTRILDDRLEVDPTGATLDLPALREAITENGRQIATEIMRKHVVEDRNYRNLPLDDYAVVCSSPEGAATLIERTFQVLFDIIDHEVSALLRLIEDERAASDDWVPELRSAILQVQTGIKLDSKSKKASRFGLNEGVRPDFVYGVTLVGDLKTDSYHSFYNTVAAGYSIFCEY